MKLKNYTISCTATGHVLGHVLAYDETDARRSAAAYGWTSNIKVKLS